MTHQYEAWRITALVFLAVGQTLFVLLYATFPWWRSILGKALFYKAVTLAVILDIGLVARIYTDLMNWDLLFVILYWMLGIGVWFQLVVFVHIALTKNRKDWDRDNSKELDQQKIEQAEREGVIVGRDEVSRNWETSLKGREDALNDRGDSQDNRETSQDSRESSQDSRESNQDSRDSEWKSR